MDKKISFKYKSQLKKIYPLDMYTGKKIIKPTVDHIKTHTSGGIDKVSNYILVEEKLNWERGSMPFKEWIDLHPEFLENIKKAIGALKGKIIDGINWSEEVTKTINRELGKNIFDE